MRLIPRSSIIVCKGHNNFGLGCHGPSKPLYEGLLPSDVTAHSQHMSRTFRHRLASSHFITYLTVFTFEGKSSWVPIHLKDILHASQGQVRDVLGPMNHFGSSTTFTKNCLHFPTGRSSDPPWEASGELIYLPWKSPPSSEAGSRHHLSTSNY